MKFDKKYAMFLLGAVFILAVLYFTTYREGFSGGQKGSFTFYYADWCGHCKPVKPVYEEWMKKTPLAGNFKLAMVESKDVPKNVGIKGFPTFIFTKTDGTTVEYSGSRDPAGWEAFLKNQ